MESKVYRNGSNIFLSGDINRQSSGEVINELLTLILWDDDQDKKTKDYERKTISLYIKSNGGTVSDMFGMIDLIESSKTKINTYAIGQIASAAVPLFLNGDKRFVYKNTEIMIHSLSGGARGTIQDISEYYQTAEDTQKRIDDFILSKTKISKDRLKEVREKKLDWYLGSEEALKLGIADEIV